MLVVFTLWTKSLNIVFLYRQDDDDDDDDSDPFVIVLFW